MKFRDMGAMAPCGVALAASLMLAGPASATIYSLTYQGVVTSALDQTGEFGLGANLVGQAFTAHVVFNDGPTSAAPWGGAYYDYLAVLPDWISRIDVEPISVLVIGGAAGTLRGQLRAEQPDRHARMESHRAAGRRRWRPVERTGARCAQQLHGEAGRHPVGNFRHFPQEPLELAQAMGHESGGNS